MEKQYHLTWCLNYIMKQLFYDENILNMLHDKIICRNQIQKTLDTKIKE